jgi:4-hydroxybenzoyl-CoA thioesterase
MPRAAHASEPITVDEDWVDTAPRLRPIRSDALPATIFRARRPVRFGDCDPAGIVYTPRFVDMMNEAIERLFGDELGLDYYGLIREGTGLGYARVGSDFFRPAHMGEVLDLAVRVGRIGGASVAFRIHAFRDGDEILRATLVMVTTSTEAARPTPLPQALRAALVAYQERCR